MEQETECNNDATREEMLMKIKEYDFAIVELGLYLDTHPEDRKALCLHNRYTKKLKELISKESEGTVNIVPSVFKKSISCPFQGLYSRV